MNFGNEFADRRRRNLKVLRWISDEGNLETSGDLAPGSRGATGRTFPLVRDPGFAENRQKTGISCSANAFLVLLLRRARKTTRLKLVAAMPAEYPSKYSTTAQVD